MSEPETIWSGWTGLLTSTRVSSLSQVKTVTFGEQYRAEQRLQQRIEDEHRVLEILRNHYPRLYRGDADLVLDDSELESLQRTVLDDVGGYSLKHRNNFLVRGLTLGVKKLGWQMSVPAPMTVDQTEPSFFTPRAYERFSEYKKLYEAFWQDLHAPVEGTEDVRQRIEAGQLLFSCLMDSSWLSKHWFDRLPEAIRAGASLHDEIVWLNLGQEYAQLSSDSMDRRRRFFPAPVTQLLLQRWYKNWSNSWPKEPGREHFVSAATLLKMYTDRVATASGLRKWTRSQLISMAEIAGAHHLPGVLVHYLRSPELGTPIPEANWLRLISGKLVEGATKASESDEFSTPRRAMAIDPSEDPAGFPDQFVLFGELKRSVDKKRPGTAKHLEKAKILANLSAFKKDQRLTPILQLLTAWAYALVSNGGIANRGLNPASVVRYLDWIGKPLIAQANALISPAELDGDEWQAIYDNCLATSKGQPGEIAGRLADFHDFLQVNYGVPDVELDSAGGPRRVDARLVTPKEYDDAKRLLRQHHDSELGEILELILILAYRCGLRRREAWSRLLNDFDGLDNPVISRVEMIVRPTKWSGIKSWAGVRRLPLWLLLTDEEFGKLESYYQRRKARIVGRGTNHPLIAQDMMSGAPCDEKLVFDSITKTLRFVTGDDFIRFHHLRHSFVSITFLRLMETKHHRVIPDEWVCGDHGQRLVPQRDKPLINCVSAAYACNAIELLSMWSGHSSPAETLRSYSHLLDWLVRSYLWDRRNPELSVDSQAALLGKTSEAVERYRNRKKVKRLFHATDVCKVFVQQWPKTTLKKLPRFLAKPRKEMPVEEPVITSVRKVSLMSAYELAYRSLEMVKDLSGGEHPRGLENAAALTKVPMAEAIRWMNNAGILASLRSSRKREMTKEKAKAGPIAPKSRLSTGTDKVKRDPQMKDPSRRWPELPNFVAPPNTPAARRYCASWYEKLLDWAEQEPIRAHVAMIIVIAHSQRSRARIKVREVERQICYSALLKILHLGSRRRLEVRIAPGRDKKQARRYWAERFDLPISSVWVKEVTDPEVNMRRYRNGRVHLEVIEPEELLRYSETEDGEAGRKKHNSFWEALRFAIMSALIVTADLSAFGDLEKIAFRGKSSLSLAQLLDRLDM